ncbi:MAG: cytochrome c biogenesis protein ResB, partial [Prevotella sp.]|nr:cytochrome c biogenesis protein ResB [Prevotella sp.]
MKKFLYAVYILIVVSLAVATIVENSFGTEFAGRHIYGAWWFTSLWTALVVLGCAWIVHRKMRRWSLLLLHGSFVIILVGAAITHFTAKRGMIHLRTGEQTSSYIISDGNKGMDTAELPYTLRLDTFVVSYHEGTDAAADFVSFLTVSDGKGVQKARVSMNNIFSYKGIRLYQNSYDDDGGGTVLTVKSDPAGIAVTYCGYA